MDTKNLCELRDQLRLILVKLEECGSDGLSIIHIETQATLEIQEAS